MRTGRRKSQQEGLCIFKAMGSQFLRDLRVSKRREAGQQLPPSTG